MCLVFFLRSYVDFRVCGSVYEKCIHDASQQGNIHPYALPEYNLMAVTNDLEAIFSPL
jgi:hypothetical protein